MSILVSELLIEVRKYVALLLLLLAAGDALSSTLTGEVIGVTDGDTISVLNGGKQSFRVRLAGIDAPERSQAFGARAKQQLSALVFRRKVRVEYEKVDRYGRILGKVKVDGVDVNLELVRGGFAWHYKAYAHEQSAADQVAYARAETEAQGARRGLWVEGNPIAPWDFRRRR